MSKALKGLICQYKNGGSYGQLRDLLVTRQDFFRDLRTLTRYLWFSDWDALFDFMLTEGANST